MGTLVIGPSIENATVELPFGSVLLQTIFVPPDSMRYAKDSRRAPRESTRFRVTNIIKKDYRL